ncbi:pectin lyase fold/virulence factor [Xylogone sp. PMI_703]|nr:pectin lyase fold/virulence factor [Xylogone sp. PMI_703]
MSKKDNINMMQSDGGRQNHDGGTTGKPALVYFPSGTYMVNTTIQMWLMTQIVGNPSNLPTLKATSDFSSSFPISAGSTNKIDLLLSGWDLTDGSTLNFYIGVRNIILDTTSVPASNQMTALNRAVSQGTSLYNIQINMPDSSQHSSIEMLSNTGCCGGGSGTMLGDLKITGGLIGIHLSGQQYLFKSITFNGCNTAIKVDSQFFATFIDMNFNNGATAIDVSNCNTGDIALIDSSAAFIGTVINACSSKTGQGSVLVENFQNTNSGPTVKAGSTTLLSGSIEGTWVTGNVYIDNTNNPVVNHKQTETLPSTNKPEALLVNGKYLTKAPPQYEQYGSSQFASVKVFGAVGDGKVDDTAAITAALTANAGCKIAYFPHGVYRVTDTIYVPPGSRLVGEVWSVISDMYSSNEDFANSSFPIPLIQVGNPGEVGVAELSDLVLTTSDILPGTILLQIHMAGINPGDVSTSNVHTRIGGAADTIVDSVCTIDTTPQQCKATFLSVHITPSGSPYIENMWAWTADHSLDKGGSRVIATGRGVLIESTEATWMMGTASKHHTLYAYNVVNAQNVVFFFQQIESPYWQPNSGAASIWTPDTTRWFDPNFANCASTDLLCQMSWGMRILGGSSIIVYGSGVWTFFDNLGNCTGSNGICQENAYEVVSYPTNTYLYCLNSKDTTNLIFGETASGTNGVLANTLNNPGGWGGDLAAYLGFAANTTNVTTSSSDRGGPTVNVQPSIWSEPNPTIACRPPCTLILPPSPLATPAVLTWPPVVTPLLSLSGGATVTVITTITVSTFTISFVPFWPITIASGQGAGLAAFTPRQSIMPPSIIFNLPGDETLSPIPSFTYVPWLTTTINAAASSTPTPIQNGTIANCSFFYQAEPGDNCTSIAQNIGISVDTFVQWNPAVNAIVAA